MKNNKGFTLVEILAVVAILSIIMIIAIPSVNSVSKNIKEKMLKNKMDLAEQGLLLWAQDNKKCFTSGGTDCLTMTNCTGTSTIVCKEVTLGDMAEYGLIDYDDADDKKVINPVDKSNISSKKITIKYNTNNKSFEITGNEDEVTG